MIIRELIEICAKGGYFNLSHKQQKRLLSYLNIDLDDFCIEYYDDVIKEKCLEWLNQTQH